MDSDDAIRESILQAGYQIRDSVWSSVGDLDTDVLAPIINPGLTGMPMWPDLRQAYKLINIDDDFSVIATDGLSDPFKSGHVHARDTSGFELEFYMVTDDSFSIDNNLAQSWQISLLNQIGLQCAFRGDLHKMFDEYGVVSMELFDTSVPAQFLTGETAGVLMGLPSLRVPGHIDLPKGKVQLVSVMLLTPQETVEAASGAEARKALGQKILDRYKEPISSIRR